MGVGRDSQSSDGRREGNCLSGVKGVGWRGSAGLKDQALEGVAVGRWGQVERLEL